MQFDGRVVLVTGAGSGMGRLASQRMTCTLRRFFPRLMWALSHRAEGI